MSDELEKLRETLAALDAAAASNRAFLVSLIGEEAVQRRERRIIEQVRREREADPIRQRLAELQRKVAALAARKAKPK
jgi:hypothetical protein